LDDFLENVQKLRSSAEIAGIIDWDDEFCNADQAIESALSILMLLP